MTEQKQSKAKKVNTDLKLSTVKAKAKSAHSTETYELADGSTITFTPIFADLKIEEILEQLQTHYQTMQKEGIELSEKMNLYFINLLIILNFTHFSKQIESIELLGKGAKAGLLDYLNYFADTGLMKTIMEDVFLPDQVNKVYEKMTDIIGASKLLDELGVKAEQKFQNLKIKNKEILGQFDSENDNVSNVLADK